VAKAVSAAVQLDVQMLTIHTSGGSVMMRAAERAAQQTAKDLRRPPPLVLGVTILTSLDSNELAEIGMAPNVEHQVERLSLMAVKAGLRGVVCSPLEIAGLRQILPADTQLVTPGIRPSTRTRTIKSDRCRPGSHCRRSELARNWPSNLCGGQSRAAAEHILASLQEPTPDPSQEGSRR